MRGDDHSDYLWFVGGLDRVDSALTGTNDLERSIVEVLVAARAIFACDDVGLFSSCNPQESPWLPALEHRRTAASTTGTIDLAQAFATAREAREPVEPAPGVLALLIQPRGSFTHLLVLTRSDAQAGWLARERRLAQEIGRRLGDVLSSISMSRSMRESQNKLDETERVAHVGYWEGDLTLDRVTWSDETYRIMGLAPRSIQPVMSTFRSCIHPDDRVLHEQGMARALEDDGRYDVEVRIVRPDGEVRTIHAIGELSKDATGRLLRTFGTIQDLTERKRAEQSLAEQHNLLKSVIDSTSDAIFVKDLELRYLMMNTAGARFLGRPVEDVIGKNDNDLFSNIEFDLVAVDRGVIESGASLTLEESATAAGERRTYVVTKSVYRDPQGKPIGLIGIAKDVTALKRLEEDFRQAQKMEAVGRLAGGVAHDFNNLLMVINNCSEMVIARLDPSDANRGLLGEVLRAGERAASLVRQLLALSRKQALEPRVVDLNALLGEMNTLLRRVIGAHVELDLVQDQGLELTKVDPGQFEQAMLNLVVNACDAMPEGGRLTIETKNLEQQVVVAVSDTGHGMDEVTRARIFEPFFTTKPAGRGTGLGLAMVYGFVKQSGGSIEVHSAPGRGARLEIYLPRTNEAPRSESIPSQARAGRLATRETILLVEDEDAVRQLCKHMLLSFGYSVLEARDGQEAIRVAGQHAGPIDMLLSDVVLPRMKGPQVAALLKEARPNLRVLFMSGHVGDDGMLESVTPLLHKPFGATALAEKIREVLERDAPRAVPDEPVRILLVDDHAMLRAGLAALLTRHPGLTVCGQAEDGETAVARFEDLRPDVTLMDLAMPGLDGVAAIQHICARHPEARILVLSMLDSQRDIDRAISAGARGYLLKDASVDELASAIFDIHAGRTHLVPTAWVP